MEEYLYKKECQHSLLFLHVMNFLMNVYRCIDGTRRGDQKGKKKPIYCFIKYLLFNKKILLSCIDFLRSEKKAGKLCGNLSIIILWRCLFACFYLFLLFFFSSFSSFLEYLYARMRRR